MSVFITCLQARTPTRRTKSCLNRSGEALIIDDRILSLSWRLKCYARLILYPKYSQKPQLGSSHPIVCTLDGLDVNPPLTQLHDRIRTFNLFCDERAEMNHFLNLGWLMYLFSSCNPLCCSDITLCLTYFTLKLELMCNQGLLFAFLQCCTRNRAVAHILEASVFTWFYCCSAARRKLIHKKAGTVFFFRTPPLTPLGFFPLWWMSGERD